MRKFESAGMAGLRNGERGASESVVTTLVVTSGCVSTDFGALTAAAPDAVVSAVALTGVADAGRDVVALGRGR
ncbi:hypothetical protein EB75_05115 [Mycobacterium sp. ST-F2]|uniref:hypothetical protein n=1 Tax=Mycobacterium sp. ST-F2 TaxID=1490484 RepID=UPI00093D0DCB|nr:hypothetical protein [Mycobacterium sp. ST-F2]OKH86114.1 hypothetical protein EB75_05115 [Mycobacterium sp. ST-F2]